MFWKITRTIICSLFIGVQSFKGSSHPKLIFQSCFIDNMFNYVIVLIYLWDTICEFSCTKIISSVHLPKLLWTALSWPYMDQNLNPWMGRLVVQKSIFQSTSLPLHCMNFPYQSVPLALASSTDQSILMVGKLFCCQNSIAQREGLSHPHWVCIENWVFFFSFNVSMYRLLYSPYFISHSFGSKHIIVQSYSFDLPCKVFISLINTYQKLRIKKNGDLFGLIWLDSPQYGDWIHFRI